ncbi:hypothetical protein N7535_004395 [Penicillium sp. DV-2018c]|nr:hypothetical protein N7461_007980 [Penicillium sp. DV-2018c]KAJ5570735.1 hypothetical protein N7535_004395 [Penicillium sp. DV-2018c]
MVTDTLALIEILSDPANRAPLEAERALAEDWYGRSSHEPEVHERPSIPDTAQPPYVPSFEDEVPVQQQPRLPWRGDTLSQFPFTATCVFLALLRDDSAADTTRPGDVQFQPLSTVFRTDCTEYGLVVIDISDLDSGVQYGITAFLVHYMATVWGPDENIDWDPVETTSDEPPQNVPVDIIAPLIICWFSPRSPSLLPARNKRSLTFKCWPRFARSCCSDSKRCLTGLAPPRSPAMFYACHTLSTATSNFNWVVFGSLPPRVIAAAIASDELRGASALSLCVDAWAGDEDSGRGNIRPC